MTKQEFLTLCDQVFKKYGFFRKGRHYYLDLGSDISGAILFQASDYGPAYYLNCGFSLKDSNSSLPYPKLTEVNMCRRISVPGKEKLANKPDSYEYSTEMIEYELYDRNEIEDCLKNDLDTWVIPAIKYGMDYILTHDEYYRLMVKVARMFHRLPE